MPHTLYVINGSHPSVCAERALQLKRQPYRLAELPPALHAPLQWLRFRYRHVPVLVLGNGETLLGSCAIVHRLDELVPSPALLPEDPVARERVEAAERWGDEVLQSTARRLFWAGLVRAPSAVDSYADGSKLPIPGFARRLVTPAMSRIGAWANSASPASARADLEALPAQLDVVDEWIEEGVIGGDQPNAADLQIGSSLRFLLTFADTRLLLNGRPCATLAHRFFPQYPGELPLGALTAAAERAAA